MINRLALPVSRELGKIRSRICSEIAASECISPSTSRSGSRSIRICSASRIFCAERALLEPKLECDNRAPFGVSPKRRTTSAAMSVV